MSQALEALTLNPKPQALISTSYDPVFHPPTLNRSPKPYNPKPSTLNPKPQTPNPKPQTRNPKP